MLTSILAISAGASAGATARWALGLALNRLLEPLPLGTLAANMLGGYLVGVALTFFAHLPGLQPEWRLLAVTGFLGGLTTFSTFSAEVVTLLHQGRLGWALGAIALHLGGSLALTALGFASYALIQR